VNPALEDILSQLRGRFERLYGDRLRHMVLYGSQARGEADFSSDIDVLVVLQGAVEAAREIDRTLTDVADLSLEHGVVISCTFMDEDRFRNRNGPLLRNVRREGVPI